MPEPRIHVDFNGIQEDGRISALARHADVPSAVLPGTLVKLWDGDGNTANGRVAELGDGGLVRIDVLLDTWRTLDDAAPSPDQASTDPATMLVNVAVAVLTTGPANCTFAAGSSDESRSVYYVYKRGGFHAVGTTFENFYKLRSVTVEAPATSDR
jgi:hypothetical protein